VTIFLLPPSMDELERRLRARATDEEAVIQDRMRRAADEISHWAEYEYVLVNRDMDECVAQVRAIVAAERSKRTRQTGLHGFVTKLIGRSTIVPRCRGTERLPVLQERAAARKSVCGSQRQLGFASSPTGRAAMRSSTLTAAQPCSGRNGLLDTASAVTSEPADRDQRRQRASRNASSAAPHAPAARPSPCGCGTWISRRWWRIDVEPPPRPAEQRVPRLLLPGRPAARPFGAVAARSASA
jgi:hypothetical protein